MNCYKYLWSLLYDVYIMSQQKKLQTFKVNDLHNVYIKQDCMRKYVTFLLAPVPIPLLQVQLVAIHSCQNPSQRQWKRPR